MVPDIRRSPNPHPECESARVTSKLSSHSEVLFFSAPHCSHCNALRPLFRTAAADNTDTIRTREINVADDLETARKLGVRVAPTLIALQNGAEIDRHIGAGNAADVERIFGSAVSGITTGNRRIGSGERRIRVGVGGLIAAIAFLSGTWWLLGVAAFLFGAGLFDLLPMRPATIDAET